MFFLSSFVQLWVVIGSEGYLSIDFHLIDSKNQRANEVVRGKGMQTNQAYVPVTNDKQ